MSKIIEKLLMWITGKLPARFIDSDGKPYLERYYVCTLPFGHRIFIHRFVASDPDRGLHDHPWKWALSFIMLGGYTELNLLKRADGTEVVTEVERKPGRFNLIFGKDFHRVLVAHKAEKATAVWTLFLHGPRSKGWGFIDYELELNDKKTVATITRQQYHEAATPRERQENAGWWTSALKGKEARAQRKEKLERGN